METVELMVPELMLEAVNAVAEVVSSVRLSGDVPDEAGRLSKTKAGMVKC